MGDYRITYELRRTMVFGAVTSSSLIFSLLFLLFLGSQISYHHNTFPSDTISEMMGYAEFFLFAYSSYFAAAVIAWRYADSFSRYSVSWLVISLLGSAAFSVSSLLRLWVSSLVDHLKDAPFQTVLPELGKLAFSMLVFACVCAVITSIGCGLASAILYSDEQKPALPR